MISAFLISLAAGLSTVAAQGPQQCDALCLANLGAGFEASQHADNSFAFYEPPQNFSKNLEPGKLLKLEDVTAKYNYTVPGGLSMSRMIYTTSDINGTTLPASAYILWPYTPATRNGYPMVAWAHGTSGVFKPCAPSNYRSLQYHFMAPYALALQGMAVVAPDYAGLGVNKLASGEEFHHPWVAAPAQANDLANAVTAARSAYPELLQPHGPFVAMGHSQGGRAAWAFAERQSSKPLSGYRGTVSISPPTRFITQVEQALQNNSATFAFATLSTQPKLVDAVTTVFPAYNYSGMSAAAYDRWFNVLKKVQGCLPTDVLTFSSLPNDQLAREGWTQDPIVQEWANLTDVGSKKFKGPMLVLVGEADEVVNADLVKTTVQDTCAFSQREHQRESIEFIEYSAMDHFPVIQASQEKWMGWIKERLGEGWPVWGGHCSTSRVEGFRTTKVGSSPNFLLSWVDPLIEGWKYVL